MSMVWSNTPLCFQKQNTITIKKKRGFKKNEQVNFAKEERKDSDRSPDAWIGGVKSEVIVDSGASCNIMSQDHWEQPKKSNVKYKPHKVETKLFLYGSAEPLAIVESFKAEVWTDSKYVKAEFVVVQSKGPILLGRQISTQLKLLLLGHVQEISQNEKLEVKYPKCFKAIKKLRDCQLQLHIDKSV